jgi:hypothetical protein
MNIIVNKKFKTKIIINIFKIRMIIIKILVNLIKNYKNKINLKILILIVLKMIKSISLIR